LNSNHYIPTTACVKSTIHSIWQVDHYPSFQKEQIIPKAVVEVIFNFSDSHSIPAKLNDKQHHLGRCFINGFNTAPVESELPRQHVFFGVQFQPLAIKKIFKVPGSEFSNTTVDMTMIDPAFNSLWHQLAEQPDFDSRVAIFLNWIKRNAIEWHSQELLINNFLNAYGQHALSVNQLANSVCYSPRHLSRKIVEATGMNAEEILLYKKYLHAVQLLHHTDLSLTAIAYQSRFSDQSHFIRSFKAYTKMTPGAYRRRKSYVKGHIYQDVR
jgi:AraC-like DNA-binding protein